jgi:hypothetical protein
MQGRNMDLTFQFRLQEGQGHPLALEESSRGGISTSWTNQDAMTGQDVGGEQARLRRSPRSRQAANSAKQSLPARPSLPGSSLCSSFGAPNITHQSISKASFTQPLTQHNQL